METLAWEEANRVRAAIAAMAGGILLLVSFFVTIVAQNKQPSAPLLNSLGNLEKPGPIGTLPSNRSTQFEYVSGHPWVVIIGVLALFGTLAVLYALNFLAIATAARRKLPAVGKQGLLIGGLLMAAALLVSFVVQQLYYSHQANGKLTVGAISDPPVSSAIFGLIAFIGILAFSLGTAVMALNAMRAGLLTRTMGILGMFSGAATVFYYGPSEPLLPLWVGFLAPLFLGRWMGGQPPAWISGKEEPWPSAAVMRENRMRASGRMPEPDPEPVEQAAPKPHPSSKKKKRKRRD